jgi:hypothetical protein
MNVLVIDVGGSHVKVLASGQAESRKFDSGPTLAPRPMVLGVTKIARDWTYDAISIGYPGPVLRNVPISEPHNLGRVGSGSMTPLCRRWEATKTGRCCSSAWGLAWDRR